jgi:hypothetical protein
VSDRWLGEREFVDGSRRPVYEDDRGQYVLADDERAYGVWLPPADEPLIMEPPEPPWPGERE